MISLSYAKISFSNVAQKLQLDSPEDAEYIVAKVSKGIIQNVFYFYFKSLGYS
jgi:26S proteasome regulatory subunit N3